MLFICMFFGNILCCIEIFFKERRTRHEQEHCSENGDARGLQWGGESLTIFL